MAVQILNAFLLLSAGFIAGNFFSSREVKTPARAPAHAYPHARPAKSEAPAESAGRGPASVPSAVESFTAPGAAKETPVDLASYLTKFAIADVHEACEFAHNRFLDQTVGAHASFVEGLDNFKEHRAYLESLGKRLAENEKFWVGKGDLELENGKARFEIVMDAHEFLPEAEDEDNASCFRAHIRVNFADGREFSTATDACTDALVTKNRSYYMNWESFGDAEIGRQLAVVQIPLPETGGAELEYMRSIDQVWSSSKGFAWEAVSLEQGLSLIDEGAPSVAQNRNGP